MLAAGPKFGKQIKEVSAALTANHDLVIAKARPAIGTRRYQRHRSQGKRGAPEQVQEREKDKRSIAGTAYRGIRPS